MKKPLLRALPVLLVLAIFICLWSHLRHEHATLTSLHATLENQTDQLGEEAAQPVSGHSTANSAAYAATLREIQAEEKALAHLKLQADELAARLPTVDGDEIIASFGKIEDMGKEAGLAVRSLLLGLTQEPTDSDFMRLLQVKGRLPEIRKFEDDADEIARFQSSALRQALALSEAAETAMQPLIREAFADMAGQNLTATHSPSENREAWMAQRSQALQQLMLGLRPHLPDSQAEATRQALTFILNLGAGLDERYHQGGDNATITLGVTWPKPPW